MVEFSVAWWFRSRNHVATEGGHRCQGCGGGVSFTAKLLSSSCYQNKPPKTRQMMIRHLLHRLPADTRNIQNITSLSLYRTWNKETVSLLYILPFLPINFFLTLSFFLRLSLLPLLLMSLQKIFQFTYIYSHSYVYSGRYSWIFYSLQLADFLALLHAYSSRSFFVLINYVLRQRTFPSVQEYPLGPPSP
jgi:hypothetical protein